MAGGDASGHGGGHFQRTVSFHEIVISEIQRHRSFKVFNLFAESVRETGQAAAMHTECVILLLDMAGGNPVNFRHPANHGLFHLDDLRRAVPDSGGGRAITERGNGVGFYYLPVVRFGAKAALNRIRICRQRVRGDLNAHGDA